VGVGLAAEQRAPLQLGDALGKGREGPLEIRAAGSVVFIDEGG